MTVEGWDVGGYGSWSEGERQQDCQWVSRGEIQVGIQYSQGEGQHNHWWARVGKALEYEGESVSG